jgi:two-component system cell cycle sensor histidine kinase/response regulator CckA
LATRDNLQRHGLDDPLFRLLFERSPDAIMVAAPDGRPLEINPAWERAWGTSIEDLRDYRIFEDERLSVRGLMPALERGFRGERVDIPELFYDPAEGNVTGRARWTKRSVHPLVDEEGSVQAVLLIEEDVSRGHEAEEAERRLQAILGQVPAAVWTTDADLFFTSSSGSALAEIGLEPEETVGISLQEFFGTDDPEFLPIASHRRALAGDTVTFETEWSGRPYLTTTQPLRDSAGAITGTIGVALDVSDRERTGQELRASEERYRDLFQNSPISLWEEDFSGAKAYIDRLRTDGVTDLRAYFAEHPEALRDCAKLVRILQVNKATVTLTGAANEEELLRSIETTFTETTFDVFRDELLAFADGRTTFEGESTGRTFRGEIRQYELKVSLSPGCEETWSKVLVSVIDISGWKRAEEALRTSERRFAVAFDSSPVTLAISTLEEGRFVAVNTTALRQFGFTAEEVIGRTALELRIWVRPEERARLFDGLEEGDTRTAEVQFRMKNGEIRTHLLSVARFDAEDRQAYLLTAGVDLTERKQTEQALRAAEERYRTLVEKLPLVTYVSELDTGAAIYMGPQVEELLGYPVDEHLGSLDLFWRILHPDDRERVRLETEAALERGELFEGEYRLIARDGRVVWIRDQAAVVRDVRGRPLYGQGFLLDITAEKQAREEHDRLEAELRQSQRLEAVGRLAGGLAHDFNNLLTAIGGYTEFLLEGLPDDASLRADAEEIRKGVQRASALTRQLLAFSRREVVERRSLDLNEIVTEMDRFLRRLIGTDVELVTLLAPGLGHVTGDRSQLEQVIVNFALNARDAMPAGGKLVIQTANVTVAGPIVNAQAPVEPGDYVTLFVQDTGVGMDAETRARVFEPFFTTKDVGEGTGLGLSTIFGIVEQSGGRIYVQSEPGQGTTFQIYLPRSERGAAAEEPPPPAVTALAGSETILLVEDEEVLRALAARTLRSQGYKVLEARYASAALELWRQHQEEIDLVVTDIVMPGMSGVELAEQLAAARPNLTIVLMSGYSDADVADRVPIASRGGFLAKPFTPTGLLRTVREAAERRTA